MLLQILKKSTLFLCAGAMLVLTSCNGDETESIESGNETTESPKEAPRNSPSINSSESQFDEGNDVIQSAPLNMNTEGNPGVRLNPPHGEPGHDCAVQVGQPLPSSPTVNSPNIVQPKINSSVKLNPPHGEPGHDCAVAVGEPLN